MKNNKAERKLWKNFSREQPRRTAFSSSLFRIRDAIVDRSTEADKDKEGTIQRGFRVADVRVDSTCFSPSYLTLLRHKLRSAVKNVGLISRTNRKKLVSLDGGKFYNFFRSKIFTTTMKFHSGYFYNFFMDIVC